MRILRSPMTQMTPIGDNPDLATDSRYAPLSSDRDCVIMNLPRESAWRRPSPSPGLPRSALKGPKRSRRKDSTLMTTRWRLKPFDSGKIRPSAGAPDLPARRPVADQSGDRRARTGRRLPPGEARQPERPRVAAGRLRGRRADRPGHPRGPLDRHLRRLRRRRRLRHERPLGLPAAGRCPPRGRITSRTGSRKGTGSTPRPSASWPRRIPTRWSSRSIAASRPSPRRCWRASWASS